MNPASLDLVNMLVAESDITLTFAVDIFVGKEPAIPNDCVTVFDTPGKPAGLDLKGNTKYYFPSCQIRVRNTGYTAGWNLINQIKELLHGEHHNEVWGSMKYQKIECVQEPFLLDWDEKGRARFVTTFNIERITT